MLGSVAISFWYRASFALGIVLVDFLAATTRSVPLETEAPPPRYATGALAKYAQLFRPLPRVRLPRGSTHGRLHRDGDLRLLFIVRLRDELAPTRHGLDLRDAVRLVVHLDELADDRAVGDRRLSIERSTVELDRDASGGGFQRGGRRSPPAPPLRAFCALSAAIRFFSALSRFGPFCFGT